MILVLVPAVPIAWKVNRTRAQSRAVAAIQRMGGYVGYDHEFSDGIDIPNGKPRGPAWLRKWLGDEYFRDVTCVGLIRLKPGTDRLGMLGALPCLESLFVLDCSLTDVELSHLAELNQLRELTLLDEAASNLSLAQWKGLTRLRVLDVGTGDTKITDAGLVSLQGLKELRDVNLSRAKKVTDAGLVSLRQIKGLRSLNLSYTGVTDAGLVSLRQMKDLDVLYLEGTRVTDAAVAEFRKARPSMTIILDTTF